MPCGGDGRTIELPWPPSATSPNARSANWWASRTAAKKYRGDCLLLIRSQGAPTPPANGPIMLDVQFCPPTRAQSDLDNLLARAKHGIDALAECMGVNDHRFEFTLRRGDPVKGGKVLVSL